MKAWYAVYTQPRHEERGRDHLARQGFEVFLPRFLKRRSHARRVTMVPMPLFPRYLFVSFDMADATWRVIRSTRGVIDLVRNGLEPLQVPQRVVDEIQRRQDADGFVVLANHLDLKRGMKIRVDTGAFAATEAIFEARRDDERVIALMTLLGREVVINVPARAVTPA
jgi:transcriptional antiterminator RfaH